MLVTLITSRKAAKRNASLDAHCRDLSAAQLLAECAELDAFRRRSENLYERVRALFFLTPSNFHLPRSSPQIPGPRPKLSSFPSPISSGNPILRLRTTPPPLRGGD